MAVKKVIDDTMAEFEALHTHLIALEEICSAYDLVGSENAVKEAGRDLALVERDIIADLAGRKYKITLNEIGPPTVKNKEEQK